MLPPPKPVEKPKEAKKKVKKRRIASAPSTADIKADRAAAPLPGASSRDSNALPNWTSQLVAKLERYKRYPSEAQSRGDRGVVRLAFSVDRGGGVHHARVIGSSGSSILDRETLSLIERASPLPPPPPEVGGSQIAVVVPVRYNAR
jgi:protein TonB